jgi:hypothetical protein
MDFKSLAPPIGAKDILALLYYLRFYSWDLELCLL